MKNYLFIFLASFVLYTASSQAQVSDDDESLAYRLKKKYPDERTACVSDVEEYEFEVGKEDGNGPVVAAIMNQKIQFISLREIASVQYGEYYDKFSSISKFKQYYKTGNSFSLYKAKALDKSVTSSDIFYDDTRVKFFNIVLPKMGLGAMVEVEKTFNDSKYLTRVMFHSGYAVTEKVIRLKVPSWLQLDIREMNFAGNKIEKTQETEGKKTVYTFTMRDLPPIPSEKNALPAPYTFPHIIVLVKSFDANGQQQKGFENAGDLYKWYNLLYKKCDNQTASFKTKAIELVKGKPNDIDKVKSVFYWVQDNIRYIAFEDGYAGFVPEPAQNVFKNKYGDCKGMANLLTEMLKLNGFDAHITWIGTKHIPYDYTVPSLCVDNHCISALNLGGKTYFLDATEKYGPFGEYAYRIQGKEALIEKGDQYQIIKVPVADKSQNKILTQASFVLQDNILKGHLKITLSGEERTSFHQYFQGLPADRKKEFLQRMLEFGNDNLDATNVKTSDLLNRELPVVIEGDIDLSNNIIRDEKEVYAGIDFFPRKLTSFTPDEKRMNAYEFNSIYTAEDEIELNIPGYKVKDLPETIDQQATDYGFKGSYAQSGNKIVLKKQLSINTGTVKKADFENWTAFLKKLKEFNNNIVVVEKDPNYVAPKDTPAVTPAATKTPVKTAAPKSTAPVKKPTPKH
jgi:hypothetical protein